MSSNLEMYKCEKSTGMVGFSTKISRNNQVLGEVTGFSAAKLAEEIKTELNLALITGFNDFENNFARKRTPYTVKDCNPYLVESGKIVYQRDTTLEPMDDDVETNKTLEHACLVRHKLQLEWMNTAWQTGFDFAHTHAVPNMSYPLKGNSTMEYKFINSQGQFVTKDKAAAAVIFLKDTQELARYVNVDNGTIDINKVGESFIDCLNAAYNAGLHSVGRAQKKKEELKSDETPNEPYDPLIKLYIQPDLKKCVSIDGVEFPRWLDTQVKICQQVMAAGQNDARLQINLKTQAPPLPKCDTLGSVDF